VRTYYKFRKIRSFLHQKVRTSVSEGPPLSNLPALTADVFYGQPLTLHSLNSSKLDERNHMTVNNIAKSCEFVRLLIIESRGGFNQNSHFRYLLGIISVQNQMLKVISIVVVCYIFQGRSQEVKEAEALLLVKSKLRKKIKYQTVLIFLCLGDLKFSDLANLWF